MFKLGLATKVKCSSLTQARTKPTYNIEVQAHQKVKQIELDNGLAQLDSLIKSSLNSRSNTGTLSSQF